MDGRGHEESTRLDRGVLKCEKKVLLYQLSRCTIKLIPVPLFLGKNKLEFLCGVSAILPLVGCGLFYRWLDSVQRIVAP
jgi:hypothetical protein